MMRRFVVGVTAVAATAAAVVAGRQVMRRRGSERGGARDRWHTVTINCEPEQLGPLPPPLDSIGVPIEVRIVPAPAGRGSELSVRLTRPVPTGPAKAVAKLRDKDPVRRLRRSLREARQLAETGEILRPNSPPTTRPTLTGAPLAYATRHAREEGRL